MKDIDADVSRLADSKNKVANAQPLLNILQLTKNIMDNVAHVCRCSLFPMCRPIDLMIAPNRHIPY